MTRYVYLAGPIAGLTEREAKDWRAYVSERLADFDIVGVSPLRCEPPIEGRYDLGPGFRDAKFGSPSAINAKNRFDTERADIVLAYLPKTDRLSIGTLFEIAWALWEGKPVIVVSDDERVTQHPLVTSTVPWILPSLDDAIEVIVGILHVYT